MGYVTRDQFKLYRGIAVTNSKDDALVDYLIDRATAQIDTYTDRTFAATSTACRYYDAIRDTSDDHMTLYLDEDLAEVTLVVNGDAKTITSTGYTPVPRNDTPYRQIRLNYDCYGTWTWTTRPESAIKVTGYWAYSKSPPADIQHATIRLTGYLYAQKDSTVFDVTMMPQQGVMTVPQGFPRDVREILEPYRRLR